MSVLCHKATLGPFLIYSSKRSVEWKGNFAYSNNSYIAVMHDYWTATNPNHKSLKVNIEDFVPY